VGRKGFSLLEMVLALALGGSVLLASVSLMTTFVELWERETKPDWEIEGQTIAKKFLENSLREAYIKLQGMYSDRGTPPEPQPYWKASDSQLGISHLFWQNHSTPPFIDNPQGRFIQYHLEHDSRKRCVRLHYCLSPPDRSSPPSPTKYVTLFHRCTYFGYAYYTFDGDSWNITLEPTQDPSGRNKLPDGFYFQFEDKTQLFLYLKKHGRFPFKAPEPQAPLPPNPDPNKPSAEKGNQSAGNNKISQNKNNPQQTSQPRNDRNATQARP
jgi:prepilin-type N-terminal cleavage/methylation domain-containing protein